MTGPRNAWPDHDPGRYFYQRTRPRATLLCVRRAQSHLDDPRRSNGLPRAGAAIEIAEYLRELLPKKPISHILATGLHEYLGTVQFHIQKRAAATGRFFIRDWRPAPLVPEQFA